MLNPDMWRDATGASPTPAILAAGGAGYPPPAFAIDPFFFARNEGIISPTGYAPARTGANEPHPQPFPPLTGGGQTAPDASEYFPYRSQDDVVPTGQYGALQMPRLTLRQWNHPGAFPLTSVLAERIFSGHDDLSFTIPSDAQQRPFPLNMVEPYTDLNSDTQWSAPEPFVDLNGNGQRDDQSQVQPSTGDYSWMLTAAPSSAWLPGFNSYSISIVVFYKRQPNFAPLATTPGERTVYADLLDGTRDGGRSALLHYSNANATEYLKVKPNSWILLSGNLNPSLNTPNVTAPLFRWYRVISVGELQQSTNYNYGNATVYERLVTLAGPDLDAFPPNNPVNTRNRFLDNLPATTAPDTVPTFFATLVEGVVNVFERTIELDR
ncbi:MAG: hypothetical protein HY000_09225 [Planctomycetes bacterium]|nr:hypothetical protein [Planctomycetota bacterium]